MGGVIQGNKIGEWKPSYFGTYIDKVDDIDLSETFRRSIAAIDALDMDLLHRLVDQVYTPGKWTVRDIFQHIIDTERIFAYRALRFSRNDQTILPGFEEDEFSLHAEATRRPLEEIITEMRHVRQSSQMLFESMPESALYRSGIMFKSEVPVLAIGFTTIGHQVHHFGVMEERYFPLVK